MRAWLAVPGEFLSFLPGGSDGAAPCSCRCCLSSRSPGIPRIPRCAVQSGDADTGVYPPINHRRLTHRLGPQSAALEFVTDRESSAEVMQNNKSSLLIYNIPPPLAEKINYL